MSRASSAPRVARPETMCTAMNSPPAFRFTGSAWRLPPLRRELEFRELECRRHDATDQCPVAIAFCRLPGMRRNDCLRHFTGTEIGTQRHAARPIVVDDLQRQRRTRVIMPALHRVDAMPMRAIAARQQEIDRGRS